MDQTQDVGLALPNLTCTAPSGVQGPYVWRSNNPINLGYLKTVTTLKISELVKLKYDYSAGLNTFSTTLKISDFVKLKYDYPDGLNAFNTTLKILEFVTLKLDCPSGLNVFSTTLKISADKLKYNCPAGLNVFKMTLKRSEFVKLKYDYLAGLNVFKSCRLIFHRIKWSTRCCSYWQYYWGENGQLYGDNEIIQGIIMVSTETNVITTKMTTETQSQNKGSALSSRQTKTVCRRLCMFLNRLENAWDKVGVVGVGGGL